MSEHPEPRIRIGTSGWQYDHWRGPFYPQDLPKNAFLEYYAERFNATEINSFFYGLPKAETVARWRDAVPADFLFAVKASRYITHMKKLKDPGPSLERFWERAGLLGDRLGPVLFQLPPKWGLNLDRLQAFLEALPRGPRYAFEFRDPSWFDERVYTLLREHNAGFCIYDLSGTECPLQVTADFVYVRLHGPAGAYAGTYDDEALRQWAGRLHEWQVRGLEGYVFFDNDEAGYAALDAERLRELVTTPRAVSRG
ncbi:hypothetical protein AN478_12525 [Thiohalorhabdus denitrificans]|uniref:Uncharacterized conserved protein YecE, DUF72 family n=1 Tax=Thiohalorhabdus denitrificans TaxID=381306 RepID=A0A0N8PMM2_9GAMM|nr:DUF72 domain-containing protein [Thiohalorhabdus denitrificans]KPV39117.1 hypothetical protein AN478_12525 [Thiohalorhabdus denitrificans]SCX77212.1 Uncharacterized conserved protein YecE, DUF72 family [Thiohalorhabdus denitrificans]